MHTPPGRRAFVRYSLPIASGWLVNATAVAISQPTADDVPRRIGSNAHAPSR